VGRRWGGGRKGCAARESSQAVCGARGRQTERQASAAAARGPPNPPSVATPLTRSLRRICPAPPVAGPCMAACLAATTAELLMASAAGEARCRRLDITEAQGAGGAAVLSRAARARAAGVCAGARVQGVRGGSQHATDRPSCREASSTSCELPRTSCGDTPGNRGMVRNLSNCRSAGVGQVFSFLPLSSCQIL